MVSALPFDDFRRLLGDLPQADEAAGERTRLAFKERAGKAAGGKLMDLATWFASWSATTKLSAIRRPQIAVFTGNHGVAKHGISRRPVSETAAMVELCMLGGAAINQICQSHDLGLKVFDLALDLPTGDISTEAAMDERGCAATMAFGMEALIGEPDILCLGSFGVGATTVATALLVALYGGKVEDWQPQDEPEISARRRAVVDAAVALHSAKFNDPFETLRCVGGREFAAIAGAIIAARLQRIPVVLDGGTAFAVAALLRHAKPDAIDHCLLAAAPANRRQAELAGSIGLTSVFDASFSGSSQQPLAGATALATVRSAVACAT